MTTGRYDNNGSGNRRRKRSRGRSSRRKHEYSDSSVESACSSRDYLYDENGKSTRRRHARKRAETNKGSNEAEAKDNSRKEEDDEDDRSVSDDSLEVIVVKKSLEKKCEKVVSGRRSKTPRGNTKETRTTKVHKRSSKKTSRSGRSKTSECEENTTDRDESPDKRERNIPAGESAELTRRRTSEKSAKEGEDEADDDQVESRMTESRYEVDGTDSTSQETVERVVVTAMVHKDQIPDTPKSTLETFPSVPPGKEVISPGDLSSPENKTPDAQDALEDKSGKTETTVENVSLENVKLEKADDKGEGKHPSIQAISTLLHAVIEKLIERWLIVIFL